MLVWLFSILEDIYSGFNVFGYLTFRSICAALTSLVIFFALGPKMIRRLSERQMKQTVRDDGPESHFDKRGTPTMGGLLILLAIVVTTLLWSDLNNRFVWVVLFTTVSFGLIGWYDDYRKIIDKDPKGMGSKNKYLAQSAAGLISVLWLYLTSTSPVDTTLIFPFFKDVSIPLGIGFIVFGYLVIVGSSNAVNLTDGLDGLAIMPAVMVTGALGVFAYVSGHSVFSEYLGIPSIPGAGELMIFCAALVGSGLGFLWFNTYPAQVFMGDIGALALGAAIGVVAVIVRQEIVLLIMGGIFVIETVSVILQVASYKLIGRRIFRMAPLHHHFELKGWPEPRVIVRFWIITFILVLIGLSALKIR